MSEPNTALDTDIAIIGAGLAGAMAATVLGRAGYRVTLIEARAELPQEFRVEKLAGDQIALLEGLGLLDVVRAASIPFDDIVNIRRGRVVDHSRGLHLGILYPDLVGAVRSAIPASVRRITGRVADVATSATRQVLTLTDGTQITARLAILATGLGDILRSRLGMTRHVVKEKQSFTFGFTIRPGADARRFTALTAYGETSGDGIDYISLFPVRTGLRANLFTFRDHRDPWILELRRDPKATLERSMPGLCGYLGDFTVIDRVQNWLQDIATVENVRQPGIVLIGDAFQTSCPAAGTGVSRLLTDVTRLCNVHLPRWLAASEEIGAAEIATYYDDPVKAAMDARALRLAEYRRGLTVGDGMGWRVHRGTLFLRRRVLGWIDAINPTLVGRLRALRQGAG